MRPRATKDLANLGDPEFFAGVSAGLNLCVANALRLWRDAHRLQTHRCPQGFQILRFFVEEEAAKFHILLDAVRCPRKPADIFLRQLGYFNAHLAKGLYANYCNNFRPADLSEVRRHMDRERQTLYLDGLNDVDWVFRNDILREREESIYVDYVAYEDHFRRDHQWHAPNPKLMKMWLLGWRPKVLSTALALHGAGFTCAAALAKIAEIWRPIPMDDSLKWPAARALNIQTLQALRDAGLLRRRPSSVYQMIQDEWLFPLFTLDLTETKVRTADLLETQRNWAPDDY